MSSSELQLPPRRRSFSRVADKARLYATLYLLLLPTIATMVIFSYYPKVDVIIKAFYRWEPPMVEEYVGAANFLDAFADPLFWQSFKLVGILLAANLVKMWPCIFTAVALHRLASDRWRYIFQVAFVVPMVIPALVWLLIWKSFYEPDFGLLNRFLNSTGLMHALYWLDGTPDAPGVMPAIAAMVQPVIDGPVRLLFSSVWGLMLFGAMILTLQPGRDDAARRWRGHVALLASATVAIIGIIAARNGLAAVAWMAAAGVAALLVMLSRSVGTRWVLWAAWLLTGIAAYWTRLPLLPAMLAVAIGLTEVLRRYTNRFTAETIGRWIAGAVLVAASLLVFFGDIWQQPTGQFEFGAPAWLGNRNLVIPALIFWGFPWVGTVGVLIYLSGLQQISSDIYEAAELDGVGPVARLFKIELPLIMTQVRINLIFMTIATLTGYEFFLILLGPSGGPGNKGMVPGLYMYQQAFLQGRFGYACALGLVLFIVILLLTVIYQRYVRVDK